jgi:hypothetical protein
MIVGRWFVDIGQRGRCELDIVGGVTGPVVGCGCPDVQATRVFQLLV